MSRRKREKAPDGFGSWEEARDYYALEAIFLGQLLDRNQSARNRRRYMDAAHRAVSANARCTRPLPSEGH